VIIKDANIEKYNKRIYKYKFLKSTKMNNFLSTKERLINTPLPKETDTYKPVSHEQLIDLSLSGIQKAGFDVEKELYAMAKGGNVATGRYLIKNAEDDEMQMQICWRNSYDKSLALTFAVGANVLICTNGVMGFKSATSFKRKHTGEIQVFAPNNIREDIMMAGDVFKELQSDRDRMKQIPVNRRLTAELLGRMFFEEKIIESTQLNIIKRELTNPSHDYISPGSLWELYQHVTFAIGGVHPSKWVQDHLSAHKFFSEAVDDIMMVTESPEVEAGIYTDEGEYDVS